jgi:hypothetical protein
MDVTTLAPVVLSYLVQYLPVMIESGKFVGGKAIGKIAEKTTEEVWKVAQPWIGRLMETIEDKTSAHNAAQRVAVSPENVKYQTALEVELEEILTEDRNLANEIKRILDQAKAAGKQISADRGGVAFSGNTQGNIVNTGHIGGDLVINSDVISIQNTQSKLSDMDKELLQLLKKELPSKGRAMEFLRRHDIGAQQTTSSSVRGNGVVVGRTQHGRPHRTIQDRRCRGDLNALWVLASFERRASGGDYE